MSTVEKILEHKGPDVITALPSATVREAAKLMAQANVGACVIKQGDKIFGIFTERDLLRRVVGAGKDPNILTMAEVMTGTIKSCRLSDSIARIQEMMDKERIRHLPVIEDGVLVGMISLRDILSARVSDLMGK